MILIYDIYEPQYFSFYFINSNYSMNELSQYYLLYLKLSLIEL